MLTLQMLVLAVICSKSFSDPGQAMCSTMKSAQFYGKTTYYMKYFCCRNFEENNGKCIECQNGFTTSNGEPCKPCEENRFGNKCAHTCRCTEQERCDSRQGCVSMHQEVSTERLTTLMHENWQTTLPTNMLGHTLNILNNESHHISIYDDDNKTLSEGNGKQIHESDYINYFIWTGCILFIILIVSSSSICYIMNTNLLLKHFANDKSALQEKGIPSAVLNQSESVQGPCANINEQPMSLYHGIETEVKMQSQQD